MGTSWTTPSLHSACGETDPYLAVQAVDCVMTTFWGHSTTEYHWAVFDLGCRRTVTAIRLFQGTMWCWGGSAGLSAYVSDDPAVWGDPVWTGVLNASGWQASGAFSAAGRYVKIVSASNAATQTLPEFQAQISVGGFEACLEQIAALLETVSITSPVAEDIAHVYSDPPDHLEDLPCFVIMPPAIRPERGPGLRTKRYTVRLRLLVSDESLQVAAGIVRAFGEAVIDAFDGNLTLNGTATGLAGPEVLEASGFEYAGRTLTGVDCLLTVVIKEPAAFS